MIYDIFAVIAIAGGLFSGSFFLRPAVRFYRRDRLLSALMFIYIAAVFWLAGAYAGSLLGVLPSPSLTLGAITRPATMVTLWIPALIMMRVGL